MIAVLGVIQYGCRQPRWLPSAVILDDEVVSRQPDDVVRQPDDTINIVVNLLDETPTYCIPACM